MHRDLCRSLFINSIQSDEASKATASAAPFLFVYRSMQTAHRSPRATRLGCIVVALYIFFAHDLIGKPLHTFPDHAL